jgi:serine/threonine-protein kinase
VTLRAGAEVIDGRYVLEPVIGRGAMAEVRAAEDLRLGRAVAVKLLHVNLAVQPEARLRFEEEARAAARLTDPNVVAVYDSGEHLGRPYIVMELLPGRTLHDELGEGPLTEARAHAVILQVLRALRCAHAAGVIHRDIKPANILLTPSGDAKVADFGIAKVAESNDLTATGLLLGTPSYLAPECITGHPATAASDLYAVGVVLYEALSGCRPFAGGPPLAVCNAILSDEPRPLRELSPQVSERLAAVVSHAMEKDPGRRYRSASDMISALEGDVVPLVAAVDEPTQAVESEPTVRAQAARTAVLPISPPPARERGHRGIGRRIFSLVAAAATVTGVALFVSAGNDRADTTHTPPLTTSASVAVPTTAVTAVTTPPTHTPTTAVHKRKRDGGHGKPPKPGAP